MTKIKVSKATGVVLDRMVAMCTYPEWDDAQIDANITDIGDGEGAFNPSTDWSQGGPITERENISLSRNLSNDEVSTNVFHLNPTDWLAQLDYSALLHRYSHSATGPTPLIAAMRCYVASKLGDDVEVPEELC